jgi:hypothetical protein
MPVYAVRINPVLSFCGLEMPTFKGFAAQLGRKQQRSGI